MMDMSTVPIRLGDVEPVEHLKNLRHRLLALGCSRDHVRTVEAERKARGFVTRSEWDAYASRFRR